MKPQPKCLLTIILLASPFVKGGLRGIKEGWLYTDISNYVLSFLIP